MSSANNMTMKVEREFTIKRKKHPSAPRYNGRANQELGSALTKLMSLLDPTEVEQLFNRELIMDEEGTALEFDAVLPTDVIGIALDFEGEGFVSTMMEVVSIENDTILGKDAYTEEEFSFTFEEASVARALGYFEVLYRKDADGKDVPFGVDNEMKVKVMVPDLEPAVDPATQVPAGLPANIGDIASASTDPEVLKGLIEAAKASGVPVVPEVSPVLDSGVARAPAAPGQSPGQEVSEVPPVEDKCGDLGSAETPEAPEPCSGLDCSTCTSCSPAKRSKRAKKVKPVEVDADGGMEQPELKRKVKRTKPVMAKSGGKWPAKKAVGITPPAGVVVIKTDVDVGAVINQLQNAGKPAKKQASCTCSVRGTGTTKGKFDPNASSFSKQPKHRGDCPKSMKIQRKSSKAKAVQATVVPVEAESFTLDEFIDKIAGELVPGQEVTVVPGSMINKILGE